MFIATVPPGVAEGVPIREFIPEGVPPIEGVAALGVCEPGVALPTCGVSSQRDLFLPPPGVGVIPGVMAPIRSVFGVSAHPGVRPGVSVTLLGVSSHLLRREPKKKN